MASDFSQFLQLLNDSQLISQINELTQAAKRTQLTESDPFDDGLDDVLRGLVDDQPQAVSTPVGSPLKTIGSPVPLKLPTPSDEEVDYGEVGELHEFGDFGAYFDNKRRKQELLDQEYTRWENKRIAETHGGQEEYPPIFKDCRIHVNGFTDPPIAEIHRLVVLYGGKFILYLTNKSAATHIICDRLTPRKRIQFRNYKVVKTQWLLDLIENKELANWQEYRLIEEVEYGQQRLQVDAPPTTKAPIASDTLVATHPDFLPHFFAKLRLHHLSTWKADLRLKFLRQCKPLNRPKGQVPRVILHIDFDSFFVAALATKYPQYDNLKVPLAVSHGTDTLDVALCNYVARQFGVRNGMWMRQAKERCPGLKVISYQFDTYEKISNEFYDYLIGLNFDVVYPVSIDEVLVDASHYIHNQPGPKEEEITKLAQMIREDVWNLSGCTVLVGASENVLMAKLALRKAKPDGFKVFVDYSQAELEHFMSDIPVDSLPGIGRHLKARIEGICGKTSPMVLPDLRLVNQDKLVSEFGAVLGKRIWEYARGIDPIQLEILSDSLGRKLVSVDVNYGIRFTTYDELDDFLMRLAQELAKRLKNLGFKGLNIGLRLARRAEGAPIQSEKFLGLGIVDFFLKSSRLGVATDDEGVMGLEMKTLYRMLNIPVADLRGVAVTMTKLVEAKSENQKKLDFTVKSRPSPTKLGKIPDLRPTGSRAPLVSHENELQANDIDWDVFNALPDAIRNEILDELTRRGLNNKPRYTSRKNLPASNGVKRYKQKLISPTKNANYVTVVEGSPTKKRKIRPLTPTKPPPPVPAPLEVHSLVLEELPTTIREEVLQDMEFFAEANKLPTKKNFFKVTDSWLNDHDRQFESPRFYGYTAVADLQPLLKQWVALSMDQHGPHEDDIARFEDYLEQLIKCEFEAKAFVLLSGIYRSLMMWEVVGSGDSVSDALKLWNRHLAKWKAQMTFKSLL